ncbi:MAG: hypothetical protein IT579_06040 [Verrucomicrobia subdivision 3 bacterium]|nr:hypothetical protein [Verrucomicrobiota bacterium]MCC6820275.1 hypothetical protein [Limisphaerales bacterium]
MLFGGSLCVCGAGAQSPLEVGSRKQVFMDQRFIAASKGVELHMNSAQKLGLILDEKGQPSSESGHTSRVIEDQGRIHLYVGAGDLFVLESEDGLHFKRVGIPIGRGELPTIFLDLHDPDPARRYKLFWLQANNPFNSKTDGIFAGYSADGSHFTTVGRVLPFLIDNPTVVDWDERIGKYVIFTRTFAYDSENQRRITRMETDDPLKPWPYLPGDPKPERLSVANAPVVLEADKEDDPHSDIYYNAATIYPWAQDVYLMFTAQFRHFSPQRNPALRPPNGHWEDFGLLEIQLASSRDGIHWQRLSREPYFPTGLADEWDRWYAVMAPGIVRRGNYLYQYYCSTGRTHDSAILRPEYDKSATRMGGIGVVRQRLDGFISADADHRGGWIETPPLIFKGNQLRLNVDTGAMGTAFVELRDADGKPIPGFTLADGEEIGGNFIDQRVLWKGKTDVSSVAGRPIRLYFKLTRAKLYGFQFLTE